MIENFIPSEGIHFIKKWIERHHVIFKIKKNRATKLGDYKRLRNGHQITINGDLDPYLFFFVLTHEIAHLLAFHQYRNILPHGKEWKNIFGNMILQSLEVYQDPILKNILIQFSKNPKASFSASTELVKYFNTNPDALIVSSLEIGNIFEYRNKKYKIEKRLQKRYLCVEIKSGKKYLFHPNAEITLNQ